MLYSCNCLSIFLNKKLNRSYTQTSVLCRYKKRIFMTFIRCKILSFLKVIKKGFPYFIPKVYKAFSATFSYNFNSVIIKIYIIDVQTNTFGYTDTAADTLFPVIYRYESIIILLITAAGIILINFLSSLYTDIPTIVI